MINALRIDFDTDYGIDHRKGWTIIVNGMVIVQFRRTLIGALFVTWRRWQRYVRDFELRDNR